jgi:hypothetical protein
MTKNSTKFPGILFAAIFAGLLLINFYSCQKAEPDPYSTPEFGTTHTVTPTFTSTTTHDTNKTPPDTTTSFLAKVNNSASITFTPSKSASGGNTTLKGVSTFYTITITFPTSSTGPGGYNIGFPSNTISAIVNNGGTYYYCNYLWGVGGALYIDSVSSGKYYGTFNFEAQDTVTFNTMNVTQGSFNHL